MITIYGRPTAWNVRKVLFFLEDIGVPYERLDYGRGFKRAQRLAQVRLVSTQAGLDKRQYARDLAGDR